MKCSKCGTEFDAKFCPECGTPANGQSTVQQVLNSQPVPPPVPQQPVYQDPIATQKKKGGCLKGGLIALGIIVVLAVIGNIIGGGKGTSSSSSTAAVPATASAAPQSKAEQASAAPSSQEADKTTSYGIGQPATADGITMTLASVNESKGAEYFKPADGKVFVLCEFNIENNSSKDLSISSVLCFEAYVDGYSVDQSITALAGKGSKQQLDGKVAAGKKMNGVIAYEVPKNWKELEIQINPDVMSFFSGKTIFKATKK